MSNPTPTPSPTPSPAPTPTIEQFADWLVHKGLAELARGAIEVPPTVVTRSGANDAAGVRIVVTIVRVEKEPYRDVFQPSETPTAAAPTPITATLTPTTATPTPTATLRDIEAAALKASGKTPVTIKALARKAGYSYGSYFRDAVRRLIDLGLLLKVTGGVKLAENASH